MKGFIRLTPIIASVIILLCATTTRHNVKPMYTTDIAITANGEMIITNKGTNDVLALSADGSVLQRWEFNEAPTGVVISGTTAFVTSSQEEGYISAINLENNNIMLLQKRGVVSG